MQHNGVPNKCQCCENTECSLTRSVFSVGVWFPKGHSFRSLVFSGTGEHTLFSRAVVPRTGSSSSDSGSGVGLTSSRPVLGGREVRVPA